MPSSNDCWMCKKSGKKVVQACGCTDSMRWMCISCLQMHARTIRRNACPLCNERYRVEEALAAAKKISDKRKKKFQEEMRQAELQDEMYERECEDSTPDPETQHDSSDEKDFCMICHDIGEDVIQACNCGGIMGRTCRECLRYYVEKMQLTHCKRCCAKYAIQPTLRRNSFSTLLYYANLNINVSAAEPDEESGNESAESNHRRRTEGSSSVHRRGVQSAGRFSVYLNEEPSTPTRAFVPARPPPRSRVAVRPNLPMHDQLGVTIESFPFSGTERPTETENQRKKREKKEKNQAFRAQAQGRRNARK